ncbi:MAG: LysM peptidoglycan-binding domain-containing protein [Lentilitoribacter sp.]
MLNLKAILMALSGVVVVGGIGTYVVLENRKSQDAPVEVSAPATTNQSVKDDGASTSSDEAAPQTDEVASTTEQEQSTEQEQATSEPASPTADWVIPAFDLLRVEPDGSTVIAGRGQPNTSLKIMNGDDMIAETEVGASGDFVVIFDEALNSGDYQLSLKVEDENGLSITSQETAIVSVPEDENGQLLAMVQKPGEASRIITQPEAAPSETASAAGTTDTDNATKTEESADEKPADTTTEVASETTTNAAAEEKAVEVAENEASEDTPSADVAGAETIVADAKDAIATEVEKSTENMVETAEKVMEKATESVAETAEKAMEKTEEVVETAKAAVETATEKVIEETESAVAALTSDSSETQANATTEQEQSLEEKVETKVEEAEVEKLVAEKPKAPTENVRIEAVEVEGDKLFVAGSGTAGYQVRVFANDEEVGIANVESNGRFIIEATKDLEVGQHQITAALEDKQTNQVILRAIVPFNRPEGQALAAVASNDNASSMDKSAESTETETAMVKEEPKTPETATEAAETETVVSAETEIKAGVEAETQVASSSDAQTTTSETTAPETSETASNNAAATMSKEEEVVKSEETMAPEDTSTVTDTSTATETATAETVATEATTDEAVAQEETTVAASNDNQTSEPKTIVQDELQPASSQSVIIRRGDTLWQIARRTYGAGVRYTTIYLANQQQIDNPDRIAPGQIFEVPEEALENSEQLHRQRLGVE